MSVPGALVNQYLNAGMLPDPRIVQGPSELIHGYRLGYHGPDFGRLSVYLGQYHMHFGPDSPTKITTKR